ncbi:unnamed protein product [Cyprideis torosa]|uniref:Uncharacterized protein n=1 Tax=Cyprideis torosa TaxID=163714 RepID=A0A7R8WHQ4_9CRUS|nr:unnamed protein product [Cyprideis torosa]CAG0896932.1 unnamed protein product [Cyprideis torosa]
MECTQSRWGYYLPGGVAIQGFLPSSYVEEVQPLKMNSTTTVTRRKKKLAKTLADLFEPGFQIPGDDICGEDQGKGVLVLILVTSAPGSSEKRRAIRETWGHYSLLTRT